MTYLLITCNECSSIYRAYRVANPTQTTINFCMYCASASITIDQLGPDDTFISHMSEKYNKDPDIVAELLEAFKSLPKTSTISWHKLCGGK